MLAKNQDNLQESHRFLPADLLLHLLSHRKSQQPVSHPGRTFLVASSGPWTVETEVEGRCLDLLRAGRMFECAGEEA